MKGLYKKYLAKIPHYVVNCCFQIGDTFLVTQSLSTIGIAKFSYLVIVHIEITTHRTTTP